MSVMGGVLLFSAGLLVGGGAVSYNRACVQRAERRGAKERDGLRREVYDVKFRAECDRAWREGYAEGRKNPLSEIERLAQTFEGRKVQVRTGKAHTEDGWKGA